MIKLEPGVGGAPLPGPAERSIDNVTSGRQTISTPFSGVRFKGKIPATPDDANETAYRIDSISPVTTREHYPIRITDSALPANVRLVRVGDRDKYPDFNYRVGHNDIRF